MIIKLKPQPTNRLEDNWTEMIEWLYKRDVDILAYDIVWEDADPYISIDGRVLKGPKRTEFILRWA